jgi:hypothetical protein
MLALASVLGLIVLYQSQIKKAATIGLLAYGLYLAYLTVLLPFAQFQDKPEVDEFVLNERVSGQVTSVAVSGASYGKIQITGTVENRSEWTLGSYVVTCRVQETYEGKSSVMVATGFAKVAPNSTGTFTAVIDGVKQDNASGMLGGERKMLNHFCRFDHADRE